MKPRYVKCSHLCKNIKFQQGGQLSTTGKPQNTEQTRLVNFPPWASTLECRIYRQLDKAKLDGQLSTLNIKIIIFLQAISYANPRGQLSNLYDKMSYFYRQVAKARLDGQLSTLYKNDQFIFFQAISYANPCGQLSNLHKMSYFYGKVAKAKLDGQLSTLNIKWSNLIFTGNNLCKSRWIIDFPMIMRWLNHNYFFFFFLHNELGKATCRWIIVHPSWNDQFMFIQACVIMIPSAKKKWMSRWLRVKILIDTFNY